jgi:hypothetical protein
MGEKMALPGFRQRHFLCGKFCDEFLEEVCGVRG